MRDRPCHDGSGARPACSRAAGFAVVDRASREPAPERVSRQDPEDPCHEAQHVQRRDAERVEQHGRAHAAGTVRSGAERHEAAERVTEAVGSFDAKPVEGLVEPRRHVSSHT